MSVKIKDQTINQKNAPFIIAEMSGNHNQSLNRALKIVEAAASTGADALKIQTYTSDTMTLDVHKGEFSLMTKITFGKETHFIVCTKRHIRPGIGMNQL